MGNITTKKRSSDLFFLWWALEDFVSKAAPSIKRQRSQQQRKLNVYVDCRSTLLFVSLIVVPLLGLLELHIEKYSLL